MLVNDWKINCENYENLVCTVPCTLYGTLLNYGKYTVLCEKDGEFTSSF